VLQELSRHEEALAGYDKALAENIAQLTAELKQANEALWEIEDRVRDCEREKNFWPEFITLARSVYKTNDRRTAIKRQINDLAGSPIVEEKSYSRY
jgi:hypothetical protein